MIEGIPLPSTDDPLDAPYWEAARRGELVVQTCGACGKRRFPPRPMCPACQALAHTWKRLSGRGRIWSFALPHPPLIPAFQQIAPYNVIVVELAEDPTLRIVGNLVASADGPINGVDPGTITIGLPVRIVFHRLTDDVTLARWVVDV